jgi:hypothetical protein
MYRMSKHLIFTATCFWRDSYPHCKTGDTEIWRGHATWPEPSDKQILSSAEMVPECSAHNSSGRADCPLTNPHQSAGGASHQEVLGYYYNVDL